MKTADVPHGLISADMLHGLISADSRIANDKTPSATNIGEIIMPKTAEMRESRFLKKEDIGRGALVTIASCVRKNVALEGADPEWKWCLTFRELDKALVLNVTNIQLCEQACGSDDTKDWIGQRIVLYRDPTVLFGGKVVGGIRVRKPKPTAPPPAPPPEPTVAEPLTDDDIPF